MLSASVFKMALKHSKWYMQHFGKELADDRLESKANASLIAPNVFLEAQRIELTGDEVLWYSKY